MREGSSNAGVEKTGVTAGQPQPHVSADAMSFILPKDHFGPSSSRLVTQQQVTFSQGGCTAASSKSHALHTKRFLS